MRDTSPSTIAGFCKVPGWNIMTLKQSEFL